MWFEALKFNESEPFLRWGPLVAHEGMQEAPKVSHVVLGEVYVHVLETTTVECNFNETKNLGAQLRALVNCLFGVLHLENRHHINRDD